jgi:hypothetical protein
MSFHASAIGQGQLDMEPSQSGPPCFCSLQQLAGLRRQEKRRTQCKFHSSWLNRALRLQHLPVTLPYQITTACGVTKVSLAGTGGLISPLYRWENRVRVRHGCEQQTQELGL